MPNKHKFFLTPLAISDIDETLAYISEKLANPIAANNLLTNIEQTIDKICDFPFAYADCSFFMIQDKNIRHVQVANYLLIYEIVEEKSSINILRFRYSAMDLSKIDLK